jgi:hypothetical protein
MLHEFLDANRTLLVARCRAKVARRSAPDASAAELEHGVSLFLDQLIKTLQVEQTTEPMASRKVSGPAGGGNDLSEVGETAAQHGRELLQHGYKVDQVVHDYGDLCQAITDLAFEQSAPVSIDEFRTLNRCLDNAIAGAVTEYAYQHDSLIAGQTAQSLNERLGSFAHELRNLIHTAKLAVTAMKSGTVGYAGATGAVLDRSLIGLGSLIDRSLADVRVSAGVPARHHLIALSDFIAEVKISASLEARARGYLLHNAFKFTQRHTEVSLRAYAAADRILIEVEDHCGGLPADTTEKIFLPFTQGSADRSGIGLGLSICQRSVKANHGILSVRDVPGSGCIFTIDLPRHVLQDPPLRLQALPLSSRQGQEQA